MEHCTKMHKILGAEEADSLEGDKSGGDGTPETIDPKAHGAETDYGTQMTEKVEKTADGKLVMSMDAFNAAVTKAADASMEKQLKALVAALEKTADGEAEGGVDGEDEQDGKPKPVKKAAPAAGIGDRSQMPIAIQNGGPHVRVMPVTKAMENGGGAPAAALTKEEIASAVVGQNPADVLKLMKSARPADIPATLAGALGGIHR